MKTEKSSRQNKALEVLLSTEGACVPLALWVVGKKQRTLKICKQFGWSEKRGMFDHQWKKAAVALGINLSIVLYKGTVGEFIETHPKGTYLITVFAHMLVVKDGNMIDPRYKRSGTYRNILGVWIVE